MAKRASSSPASITADQRIILLKGPDAFLRWLKTGEIREALKEKHGNFDAFQFDGESARLADILDECRTFGLMAGHKLIIVDSADKLIRAGGDDDDDAPAAAPARRGVSQDNSPRGLLTRYAESPSADATLVLRAATWRPGNLDKAIEASGGAIISCDELAEDQARAWALERATTTHATKLNPDAAQTLIERLGTDLGRIDGEIAKLAIEAGDGGTITREMVAQSVGFTREEEAWDLQRVLLTSDAPTILGHVRQVVEISRQPATLVTWACTDLARKLHGACVGLKAGANPFQLAGTLKLWGESKDTILAVAAKISPPMSARLLSACVEADTRQKSGLGEAQRSIEGLAIRFARLRAFAAGPRR
jgi:DNA polymerase-3 subunit delta